MDPNAGTPEHIEPPEELLTQSTNADMLAAVNAAIDGAPEPAAETPAVETEVAAETPASGAEGEAAPGAAPEAAAETPAATVETPAATARPSDEFGELPKDVKAETRERFETMRSKYDALHTQFEQAQAENHEWVQTIQSTGATPQQFGETLQFLSDLNSGSVEGLQRAYDVLQENLKIVAQAIGREAPGADPLAAHPDLLQQVQDHDITREAALELAQHRAQQRLTQAVNQTQRETHTVTQARQTALSEVRALGEQLRANDPHAPMKLKAIESIVERVIQRLPPAEWAGAIRDAYDAVPAPAAAAPVAPAVAPTPLRPTSTPGVGGGLTKQPGSALEAMELALRNM